MFTHYTSTALSNKYLLLIIVIILDSFVQFVQMSTHRPLGPVLSCLCAVTSDPRSRRVGGRLQGTSCKQRNNEAPQWTEPEPLGILRLR